MKDNKVKDASYEEKNSNYTHKITILYLIITALLCVIAVGCVYEFYLRDYINGNDITTSVSKIDRQTTSIKLSEVGLADSVEKVYDAVVVIENYKNGRVYSSGSGFVFKTDNNNGYIITNNHVISRSNDIKVTLSNEKTVDATLVGSDEYSDVAVLSIPKSSVISVATTGSSEDMRVGDTTFTVGAPLDSSVYSWTVTRGILSGKNRKVETQDSIMEVLQTDAAINSGNSGGPLCNANGEVIGITNMKLASSTIEGIGFAIPIETALEISESLISGEKINRPYLGISIYASTNRRSMETSLYVDSVEKGSLAEESGIKEGDKILKINNIEVTTTADFRYNLYKYNAGDKITIAIERNNKEMDIPITLK